MKKVVPFILALVMLGCCIPGIAETSWYCSQCGRLNTGKFCPTDGTEQPAVADAWYCPECGCLNTGNFCPGDGTPRPEDTDTWTCPNCGQPNFGTFCPADGTAKPSKEKNDLSTWQSPDTGSLEYVNSMINLYDQPEDSIDVLIVGSSPAYADINTNVLWEEYGIAAYNLCSPVEPYWCTYYRLKEALKTQHPRIILLDAKASTYKRNPSLTGNICQSIYGIQGSENFLGAVYASFDTQEEAEDFLYFTMPEFHSQLLQKDASEFESSSFWRKRGSCWKGYVEIDNEERHEKPTVIFNKVRRNMNEQETEYAQKIFDLAYQQGIEIMLIGFPNPDYANDHMYYNMLWSIAEEYSITGINYNDPDIRFGLKYSRHFADWQHLNVTGSIKFSRKLAEDLKERYHLPDRRGDPYYASYDECARQWYELYPTFESAHADDNPLNWFDESESQPETSGI